MRIRISVLQKDKHYKDIAVFTGGVALLNNDTVRIGISRKTAKELCSGGEK